MFKQHTAIICSAALALISTIALGVGIDRTNRSGLSAGGFALLRGTADGGGGTSSGAGFVVRGTAGQPDAGALSGGSFVVSGGFWQPAGAPTVPQDLNNDGSVNSTDLALLLGDWGPCPAPCTPGIPDPDCPADFDDDCDVDSNDLAQLLGAWTG